MAMNYRKQKGVLMTLITLILFLLMLGELVMYTALSTSYNILAQGSTVISEGAAASDVISAGAPAFLHQSLQNALDSLIAYDGNAALRHDLFANNTQYALKSLMRNGTLYGNSLAGPMKGATLDNYVSGVKNTISAEGFNIIITNETLSVFQDSPFTINASYAALAIIRSTRGTFTYPVLASANISLNGTRSLYGAETGDSYIISPKQQYPVATPVGNIVASSGNTAAGSFVYGTIVAYTGTPTCGSISSAYENANYIIAAVNAISIPSNLCGAGGLVTYAINSPAPAAPYLVIPGSADFNSLRTGTSALLNGKDLKLLDLTALQDAIQNEYSFAAPYAPSYLDWGNGNLTHKSRNGIFSLGILNRKATYFNGASSYIHTSNILVLKDISMSAWIFLPSLPSTLGHEIRLISNAGFGNTNGAFEVTFQTNDDFILLIQTGSTQSNCAAPASSLRTNTWQFLTATYNYTTGYANLYLNGNNVLTNCAESASPNQNPSYQYNIGQSGNPPGGGWYYGLISNAQMYSRTISSNQVAQLYGAGIAGRPLRSMGLVGWWPLTKDANDYSGYGDNGTGTNTVFSGIKGYASDAVLGGSLYNANALNLTRGVLNCGTLAQCTDRTLPHLYLANTLLTGTYGYALNESAAFGLSNSLLIAGNVP